MKPTKSQINGVLYGTALGDAWGYIPEFMSFKKIQKTQPKIPALLTITDDTQMSLYNMFAMRTINALDLTDLATNVSLQNQVRKIFANEHLKFFFDKNNTRAPGLTCMGSLALYSLISNPVRGDEASQNNSLGCGTVMRSTWLGLLPYSREIITSLAILQAQTTHGHPAGGIASAIAALTVYDLIHNSHLFSSEPNSDGLANGYDILDEIESYGLNLVDIKGVIHMRNVFIDASLVWNNYVTSGDDEDINLFFGEGWAADSALINALAVLSTYNTPKEGLKRLVYTNGDSDSIAAIGGAFLGAKYGYKALDEDVKHNLEARYENELQECSFFLQN